MLFVFELCLLILAPHIRDTTEWCGIHGTLSFAVVFILHTVDSSFSLAFSASRAIDSVDTDPFEITKYSFFRSHPGPCGLTSICAFLVQFSPTWAFWQNALGKKSLAIYIGNAILMLKQLFYFYVVINSRRAKKQVFFKCGTSPRNGVHYTNTFEAKICEQKKVAHEFQTENKKIVLKSVSLSLSLSSHSQSNRNRSPKSISINEATWFKKLHKSFSVDFSSKLF